jgi:hypothetical protein
LLIVEDTLEIIEFLLVGLLGFMPLFIIHWADRHPRLRLPRFGLPMRRLITMAKAGLLVMLAHWTSHFDVF